MPSTTVEITAVPQAVWDTVANWEFQEVTPTNETPTAVSRRPLDSTVVGSNVEEADDLRERAPQWRVVGEGGLA